MALGAHGSHDEVENRLHAATRGLAYRRSKCPTDVVAWAAGDQGDGRISEKVGGVLR